MSQILHWLIDSKWWVAVLFYIAEGQGRVYYPTPTDLLGTTLTCSLSPTDLGRKWDTSTLHKNREDFNLGKPKHWLASLICTFRWICLSYFYQWWRELNHWLVPDGSPGARGGKLNSGMKDEQRQQLRKNSIQMGWRLSSAKSDAQLLIPREREERFLG